LLKQYSKFVLLPLGHQQLPVFLTDFLVFCLAPSFNNKFCRPSAGYFAIFNVISINLTFCFYFSLKFVLLPFGQRFFNTI